MERTRITEEEWLAEIDRLCRDQESQGMTSKEIADMMNVGNHAVIAFLHRAVGAGLMICKRGRRRRIDGQMNSVPVYIPVEQQK